MKLLRVFPVIAFLSCLVFSSGAFAVIDNNAAVVSVRTSCTEGGVGINNCFTNLTDLTNWLAATRKPNAASPLVVNIGPGTFESSAGTLFLRCNPASNYEGYVSFIGAGRQQTIIAASNGYTVDVSSCTKMDFSNLKVYSYGTSGGGIQWLFGGDSTWSNVDVDAQYYGWLERSNMCGESRGKHYWFGSRLMSREIFGAAVGYKAACDESWFFGSEISETASTYLNGNGLVALGVSGQAEAHVYGSAIRAISDVTATGNGPIVAVNASNGGIVHIHGTGIDVISSVPNNLVALNAATGGLIHANESSYNLSTPSGTVTRIKKDTNINTHVHAPYLWEHIPDPTTIPNFTSVTGADTTTEVVGADINMLVYNSQCTGSGGPWYNVALRTCR